MPPPKAKESWLSNNLVQLIPMLIIFIATAAVMHSQVSDLKVIMKDTRETMQSFSERLTRVETHVQFMYDERKRGN